MPIDGDSLSSLDLGSYCFSKNEREARMHMKLLFTSVALKHLAASFSPLPITPFNIVAYAFVGQRLSKQL